MNTGEGKWMGGQRTLCDEHQAEDMAHDRDGLLLVNG